MRSLPPGTTWLDAIYNPRKVVRLRRKQREEGSGRGFTKKQFAALVKKYDRRCVCCGKRKRLGPDHIVPLSKGGPHDIRNIQPLCKECNFQKRTEIVDYRPRDVREWLRELRGRCTWGSATEKYRCKNLAVADSPERLCHVHERPFPEETKLRRTRRAPQSKPWKWIFSPDPAMSLIHTNSHMSLVARTGVL